MLNPKLVAAILAAVNAYIDEDHAHAAQMGQTNRWVQQGRLDATKRHLPWSRRDRRW